VKTQAFTVPVGLANPKAFLHRDMTSAGTATTFSVNAAFMNGSVPQRLAIKHDAATTVSVTLTYYPADDMGNLYTDTISVAKSTTAYTKYAVGKLVSVTWPAVTGKYLDVGFYGYPFYYVGDCSHGQIVGASFQPFYRGTSATDGVAIDVTIATEGTPAANKVGYHAASRTIHYCYPVDGSSYPMAGMLTVTLKSI
jgi:hypothetical protein